MAVSKMGMTIGGTNHENMAHTPFFCKAGALVSLSRRRLSALPAIALMWVCAAQHATVGRLADLTESASAHGACRDGYAAQTSAVSRSQRPEPTA